MDDFWVICCFGYSSVLTLRQYCQHLYWREKIIIIMKNNKIKKGTKWKCTANHLKHVDTKILLGPAFMCSIYCSLISLTIFKASCTGNCDFLSVLIKFERKCEAWEVGAEKSPEPDAAVRKRDWTRVGCCSFHVLRLDWWHVLLLSAVTHRTKGKCFPAVLQSQVFIFKTPKQLKPNPNLLIILRARSLAGGAAESSLVYSEFHKAEPFLPNLFLPTWSLLIVYHLLCCSQ